MKKYDYFSFNILYVHKLAVVSSKRASSTSEEEHQQQVRGQKQQCWTWVRAREGTVVPSTVGTSSKHERCHKSQAQRGDKTKQKWRKKGRKEKIKEKQKCKWDCQTQLPKKRWSPQRNRGFFIFEEKQKSTNNHCVCSTMPHTLENLIFFPP